MRNVVLIGHPDPARLEELVDTFEANNFRCLTAQSGAEALSSVARYGPQLAVLHVDLPEVEGTDVCLRIKQEEATKKVGVLLIGKDGSEERFVGAEVGADAYLAEPYDDDALLEKVRELFDTLHLNVRQYISEDAETGDGGDASDDDDGRQR